MPHQTKATPTGPSFDLLSDSALVREAQLVRNHKRPTVEVPIPFSSSTLWRMVKLGCFPRPIKVSNRITCWRVGEVRAWINAHAEARATV